jgi:2-keto-4-pentenoate hydratase
MSVRDAYLIQLENVARRKSLGQKVIGMKIGLTSRAMQELMGVATPDYGHLLKLRQTIAHSVAMSILVLNLRKIQCALFYLFTFLMRCILPLLRRPLFS